MLMTMSFRMVMEDCQLAIGLRCASARQWMPVSFWLPQIDANWSRWSNQVRWSFNLVEVGQGQSRSVEVSPVNPTKSG